MDIGIALPQYGGHARPEWIVPFARRAEEAGFGRLWVGDRSLAPVSPSRGRDEQPRPGDVDTITAPSLRFRSG